MNPGVVMVGVFVLIVLGCIVSFIYGIRADYKKYLKEVEESKKWVEDENAKPKFRLRIYTKAGASHATEPFRAYADHMGKATSYEAAHEYAQSIVTGKSCLRVDGEKYIPACDIGSVLVESENQTKGESNAISSNTPSSN